ncbi:thioesterase family protein [Chamaesiphon sp. OTE_75_metabat_556]|uniref:acyl-CoA thioesterase n=1 Tax=Chamaesiphon sp. OTE_75_metabat_556 TaxID=2964692 RepID=UPI00286B50A0|nr:thioesterase family protein [Chamaesiphon sp. OTE_75_metabat_556]
MTQVTRALEVTLQIPIRTYDIDFAGVVSNIVYIRWLEDLRIEIMNRHYPIAEQVRDGLAPVVLQTNIDYKQALKMGDRPTSTMWVASLATLRWTVSAEISNAGKVAAIAQQTGIFVNLQTNKPIRVPSRLQQQYTDSLA